MEDKKCERCEFYIIAEDTAKCLITDKEKSLYDSCNTFKERTGNHVTI